MQTQSICITFVQRRPNVFDVGPTLYKYYTNVLCLLDDCAVTIMTLQYTAVIISQSVSSTPSGSLCLQGTLLIMHARDALDPDHSPVPGKCRPSARRRWADIAPAPARGTLCAGVITQRIDPRVKTVPRVRCRRRNIIEYKDIV